MTGEPLKVAVILPLTGEGDWIGRQCIDAARAALELARQRGLGGAIELVPVDARHPRGDGYDPRLVDAEAERVIAEVAALGCTVLMGTISSAQALPLAGLAARRGLFFWEAIAAADELTSPDRPLVCRLDTTAREYGRSVVAFVADELAPAWGLPAGAVRLGIAQMTESFCESVTAAVRAEASARGMAVVAHPTFPVQGADLPAVARALRDARPDVVFMTAFGPNVPEFWRAARAEGLDVKALIGNGAWALEHRVRPLGTDIEGVFLVDTPHVSSMGTGGLTADARAQLDWWKARCGEPHTTRTAVDRDLIFIATYVLATEVLPRAGAATPGDLRRAAAQVDIPLGGTILGYGVRFDARGENERTFGAIFQWQDGRREIVKPDLVATARPRTQPLPRWADRPLPQ